MIKQHLVGSVLSLVVFGAVSACASTSAAPDQVAAESSVHVVRQEASIPAEREWLQQLVGKWDVTTSSTMEPGTEPMKMKGSEIVTRFGDLWVVGDGSVSMDGTTFLSRMTLGYDEQEQAFVGTWIDTLQSNLWVYRGQLDEAGKVLSLMTEGPSFFDPTATATYRDSIELVSPDHRVLRSAVRGDDGAWTQFMEGHYRRKR